jgi:hypothetical protein
MGNTGIFSLLFLQMSKPFSANGSQLSHEKLFASAMFRPVENPE